MPMEAAKVSMVGIMVEVLVKTSVILVVNLVRINRVVVGNEFGIASTAVTIVYHDAGERGKMVIHR